MSNMPESDNESTPVIADGSSPHAKDEHDCPRSDTSKSEAGWKAILEYGTAQDEKLLSEWKDELANLLTFTGLFSAVVTGFIAVTLPMLQEDPATKSAVLLAQISQQLASFSVGNQFINSTVPVVPDSQDSDAPDPLVVRLNILWVLSLTLSVMAAFFTITVQQWLRRIPLPPHLSVREAVRLWRMRQFGITAWKVPAIISLLPVLVQVSVVLFLVGLYFLLETLHHTTALVLLVFGSALLGLFVVSSVLPLLFKVCPYKSPVIPAVFTIAQMCALPTIVVLWAFFMIIGNAAIAILQVVILEIVRAVWWMSELGSRTTKAASRLATADNTSHPRHKHVFPPHEHLRLMIAAFSFNCTEWVTHQAYGLLCYVVAPDTFWDRHELRHVTLHRDQLDCQALAVTVSHASSLWQEQREALQSCLADISPTWRALVGTNSLHRVLVSRYRDVSMVHPVPRSPVFLHASDHLPRMVSELEDVLWQSLPKTWADHAEADGKSKSFYDFRAASLICLLYKNNVMGLNPEKPPTESSIAAVAKALIAIQAQQRAEDVIAIPRQRHPTSLLFGCCFRGYVLSKDELHQSIAWTLGIFRSLTPRTSSAIRVLQREAYAIPRCDVILGSLATALMACTSDSILETNNLPVEPAELSEMLDRCAGFLTDYAQDISLITSVVAHVPPDKHMVIVAQALASVANSITRLAVKGHIATSSDCPSFEVVRLLRQICGDAYGDELRETERFVEFFERLEHKESESGGSFAGRVELPERFQLIMHTQL